MADENSLSYDEYGRKMSILLCERIVAQMTMYFFAEKLAADAELTAIDNRYDDKPKIERYIRAVPHIGACMALANIINTESGCQERRALDFEKTIKAALIEAHVLAEEASSQSDASDKGAAAGKLMQEGVAADEKPNAPGAESARKYGSGWGHSHLMDHSKFERRLECYNFVEDMAAIGELHAVENPYDGKSDIEHYLRALAHIGAAIAIGNVIRVERNYAGVLFERTPDLDDATRKALIAAGVLEDKAEREDIEDVEDWDEDTEE